MSVASDCPALESAASRNTPILKNDIENPHFCECAKVSFEHADWSANPGLFSDRPSTSSGDNGAPCAILPNMTFVVCRLWHLFLATMLSEKCSK
jgi:hypothetical protein